MLQRSVKTGIATLANPPAPDTSNRELVTELASVSTRIVDVERMLDRTLFTACAAYCYARSAAMGDDKTDEVLSAETNRAYDRQCAALAERPCASLMIAGFTPQRHAVIFATVRRGGSTE